MTLRQLYYTSCVHGLSGYVGFQFNAVTPGVDPRVMREVEQLAAYHRPRHVKPGAEPVNLFHSVNPATGTSTTAQVVYAGADPSGRPGNYFAHAVSADDARRDLGGLLPIELWSSRVWATTPVDGTTELPEITGSIAPGALDRIGVADFLSAQGPGAARVLAGLLTAAAGAVDGGRPVVLRSPSATHNAYWIAAVSYLLDEAMARRLSFSTYTSRAERSPVCLTGTIADSEPEPVVGTAEGTRLVVDLASANATALPAHPAAVLLEGAGPLRAAGLWRRAHVVATGRESTLDDWLPVLAAAHLLGGVRPQLDPSQFGAVATWFADRAAMSMPTALARSLLRCLLHRSAELPADLLRRLVGIARRTEESAEAERIEMALLARATDALSQGRTPGAGLEPITDAGRTAVAGTVSDMLDSFDAFRVVVVLGWCRHAQVDPPAERVRAASRRAAAHTLDRVGGSPLTTLADHTTGLGRAVAMGLADHLEYDANGTSAVALAGALGRVLAGHDLHGHPALCERLRVLQVGRKEMAPAAALLDIASVRPSRAPAAGDMHLLAQLWDKPRWTPAEALTLLDLVGPGTAACVPYLEAALKPPSQAGDQGSWLDLVKAVVAHPVGTGLSGAVTGRLRAYMALAETVEEALVRGRVPSDAAWFRSFDAQLAVVERHGPVPEVMVRRVARAVLDRGEPAPVLVACGPGLFEACCDEADEAIRTLNCRAGDPARWFVAGLAMVGSSRQHEFTYDCVVPALATLPGSQMKDLRRRLANTQYPVSAITGRQEPEVRPRRRLARKARPVLDEFSAAVSVHLAGVEYDEDDD